MLENDPIHKMTEPLRKAFQNFKTETEIMHDKSFDVSKSIQNVIPLTKSILKVGRNDPCPCGSGKKYKKCCMLKKDSDPIV